MTTKQKINVDYATIISHIDKLDIRVFDFINHLKKGERIGGGSVMIVHEGYLSVDGKEPVRVALKEPVKRITSKTSERTIHPVLNDIRQELRIMKHLESHPYIINLFGVAFEDLNPVLVVEYATSTLSEYLYQRKEEGNIVDWLTKSRICCEIADGLYALHQVNIVHGDIKGNNILLFQDENDEERLIAKLSDFGFSSTKISIGEGRGTGMTPNFCAPECTRSSPTENKPLGNNQSKDNYSYGLLVWQTAKDGEEPFEDMEEDEIDELKHSDKELKILVDQLDDEVPEEFRTVIIGMTRYNPKDRISLLDVRNIMKNDDNITYFEVKHAFEAAAMQPSKEFGLPLFNSIKFMALSTPIKSKLIRSYENSASNGDAEAACFLSICYASGFGVERDKVKMVTWAIKAAERGNLEAIKVISSHYKINLELKDYGALLFPWLLKTAEAGHRDSLLQVADCYRLGIGINSDWEKSEEYMKLYGSSSETPLQPLYTLHHAAREGNFELVKFILQQEKLDINLKDDKGLTSLHRAVEGGYFKVAQILLEFGADVNAEDERGQTPLHFAAQRGDVDAVKFFLTNREVDINAKDEYDETPLHFAAQGGHMDVVKFLVTGHEADVNAKSSIDQTPLHLAVLMGHIDIVKFLVTNHRADVNAKDIWDQTPLHLAVQKEYIDIVKFLVTDHGADVNAKSTSNQTPLHLAVLKGHIDIVKFFVTDYGADVNAKNMKDQTLLHLAVLNGHIDIVKFLVTDLGADVNAKNNFGQTPLHLAASFGNIDAIKLLASKSGVDVNATDNEGHTPVVCAIKTDHLKVFVMLLDLFRVDVNMKDANGQTLLHLAVKYRNEDVIKLIVEKFHPDMQTRDKEGHTALELADEPPVHLNYICSGCKKNPIIGERYKCADCYDFDFCSACYSTVEHNPEHIFKIIKLPTIKHLLIPH